MAGDIRGMEEVAAYRRQLKLTSGGPRYATIRIAPGNVARALPARDGVYLKNRFRENLGLGVN